MMRAAQSFRGTLMLLPMAIAVVACNGDTPATSGGNDDQIRIVAKVNDEPISEAMLQFHIIRRTGQNPDTIDEDQRETLLLELVEMTLIAQDARAKGLDKDEAVQARMRNLHHAVLAQAMLEELKRKPVPEDKLLDQFDQLMESKDQRKEYHARHILLADRDEAEAVIEKLDNGEDFEALAKQHSRGPTASRGGDLGWFVPGDMVKPFGKATMALNEGEYTREPVRTQFGYHVIKLERQRDREPPRFEEVTEQLERTLTQERIESYVRGLRNEGDVELYRPQDSGE